MIGGMLVIGLDVHNPGIVGIDIGGGDRHRTKAVMDGARVRGQDKTSRLPPLQGRAAIALRVTTQTKITIANRTAVMILQVES